MKIRNNWFILSLITLFVFEACFLTWLYFDNKDISDINILNPHFHPVKGGNWTVFFNTKGKQKLAVKPQDLETIQDMEFLYALCEGSKVESFDFNNSVQIPEWRCNGQGAIVYKIKKLGNHNLEFSFGNKIAYAHNSSVSTYDFSASSSVTRFGWTGQDDGGSIPVDTSTSTWAVVSSTEFTSGNYTASDASDNTYTETSAATTFGVYFPQIVHDFSFRINEATNTITQIDYHWEGIGTQSEELAADNDLRLYAYDDINDQFILIDSELNNSCGSSDCTMTYSTSNATDLFDADLDIRFVVQKYEMGNNCSSSPASVTCGKRVTSTNSLSETYYSYCDYQESTEDLWDQCNTSSGYCYTGYCNGGAGSNPAGPASCNIYADNLQHYCSTCYKCSSSASTSCVAATDGTPGALGCNTGPCYTCNSGSCDATNCEGIQCGCQPGETCVSGTCTPSKPDCATMCMPQTSGCVPDAGTCFMMMGIPVGPSSDCIDGTPECCCEI